MSTRISNGVQSVEPASPGPNSCQSPAPSPSGNSKSSRPSGSSSSKSRQRTMRENAKPRVDNAADGVSSPIPTEDGSSSNCGDRRSSGEVETGDRWKGRVSPEITLGNDFSGSIRTASPANASQNASDATANGHGSSGGFAPPSSGSKSGRRHVRDMSANGVDKESYSDNLGDNTMQSSRSGQSLRTISCTETVLCWNAHFLLTRRPRFGWH